MKNKFNFFLSALLVLVFITGLNTFSYASSTDLTDFEIPVEWFDKLGDYIIFNKSNFSYSMTSLSKTNFNAELMKNYYDNNIKSNLKTYADSIGATEQNLICFFGGNTTNSNDILIYITFSNNSIGDLNYLNLDQDGYSSQIYTLSSIPYNAFGFRIITNGIYSASTLTTGMSQNLRYKINFSNLNTSEDIATNVSLFGFNSINNIFYFKSSYNGSYTGYYRLNDYYDIQPEPEIPDNPENPDNPDIPGGSGNTGNITNPSGESTGKVDLSGIENSLNNIENKIPTSGDIKDSQVQGNKEFWGNTDDIDPEDFENELENNFNGIMENLSGELTQNQIFESLQGAENGFLNFFKEEQNEEFYDLAFSWPDVEFMGGVLIPAGGINISEMCREIPELERLRSIIRVIFNFSVAVSLIKQIYNLILSTLGIDNPYLYEDYDEVTSINEDTGEYRQTAVRRKKIYNRRR